MTLFDEMTDANSLYDAFNKAKRNSIWKESNQKYEANLLLNIYNTQKKLRTETYIQKPFNIFVLSERGHTRIVKSLHISDRVVQRALCDRILLPSLYKHFIYDNGASMKNRGISFTRKRLKTHLHRFYRKYGNDGYIMLCDFKKFFDNIPHVKLKEYFFKYIKDEKSQKLINYLIDGFKIDVSYMSDSEYEHCMDNIFNSIEHNKINKERLNSTKFMYKSVGVGSQLSQISGVGYVTILDTFIKYLSSVKFYGRYMDDFYIIHNDKSYLLSLYDKIKEVVRDMDMFLNDSKTRIICLKHEFMFLKANYRLSSSGKIYERMNHESVRRHRRKMRKLITLYSVNKRDLKELQNLHKSCLGSYSKFNSYFIRKNITDCVNDMFISIVNNKNRSFNHGK